MIKCRALPVGINTMGNLPKCIAQLLKLLFSYLPDITLEIKFHILNEGWQSNSVPEGYVENQAYM